MGLNTALALAVTVTLFASTLDAQTKSSPTTGIPVQSTTTMAPRGLLAPELRSPEVHPDRTVTFRLRAPQATTVELVGEVLQGKPSHTIMRITTPGSAPSAIWMPMSFV